MEILKYLLFLFIAFIIYLNILSTISILKSTTLSKFQKNAQIIFTWLIPVIGSKLVLKLLSDTEPEAIKWIPQRGQGWLIVAGTYHGTLHGRENEDVNNFGNSNTDNTSGND